MLVFDQPTSGLANLGNTCYMNAVIECLRHCSPFMRYLFGQEFHEDRVCFVNRKPMQLGKNLVVVYLFSQLTTSFSCRVS
jgi:ubiquitin C-terminal hydrolase